MEIDREKTPVRFYQTATGTQPVLNWMRTLAKDDRQRIGEDLARVQYGWPVGMPLCRSLGAGLWEVRSSLPSRRIARLLFFFHEGELGVVHGFVKKTQKAPAEEITLARRRIKEMLA
jgi:phage-related protein